MSPVYARRNWDAAGSADKLCRRHLDFPSLLQLVRGGKLWISLGEATRKV